MAKTPSTMKAIGTLILLSVALIVSAQTTQTKPKKSAGAKAAAVSDSAPTNQNLCCRFPLRTFGQSTVNLTPLFQWWKQHAAGGATAKRPLPAWHRISGVKAGELEYSWLVDAEIYTNSGGGGAPVRIILKNPPVTEEQTYYQLKSELAAAVRQMTNDQLTYQADTAAAQKGAARPQTTKRGKTRRNTDGNAQTATQNREAAAAALDDEKQLEQATALVQRQFAAIPARNGTYRVDLFALEIGRDARGVPIYDLGVVNSASP